MDCSVVGGHAGEQGTMMIHWGKNQALRHIHHGPAVVKKKYQDTHYLRIGNLSREDRISYVDGGHGSE